MCGDEEQCNRTIALVFLQFWRVFYQLLSITRDRSVPATYDRPAVPSVRWTVISQHFCDTQKAFTHCKTERFVLAPRAAKKKIKSFFCFSGLVWEFSKLGRTLLVWCKWDIVSLRAGWNHCLFSSEYEPVGIFFLKNWWPNISKKATAREKHAGNK